VRAYRILHHLGRIIHALPSSPLLFFVCSTVLWFAEGVSDVTARATAGSNIDSSREDEYQVDLNGACVQKVSEESRVTWHG